MSGRHLRRPPSYMVYAADDLAKTSYYGLSVGERGLLDTMKRVAWVEDVVPREPSLLARVCRLPLDQIELNLTPQVLRHFEDVKGQPDFLRSVELAHQMENLLEGRAKMSAGGREGAKKTNESRDKAGDETGGSRHHRGEHATASHAGYPVSARAGSETGKAARSERGREMNEMKWNDPKRSSVYMDGSDNLTNKEPPDPWISEYERGETEVR